MRQVIAVLIIALALVGCAMSQPRAQVHQRATPQPAGKVSAGVQAPNAGVVSAAVEANREVGSTTAGARSSAYTVVNSPWPTVAFGLGCGLLLILWQHEKRSHRSDKARARIQG